MQRSPITRALGLCYTFHCYIKKLSYSSLFALLRTHISMRFLQKDRYACASSLQVREALVSYYGNINYRLTG